MSFTGILFYVARALVLAAPVTLILYGIRRLCMRGKRVSFSREAQVLLFMLYGACLIAITAVRDGAHLLDFWKIPHSADSIQLIPIAVTLQQGRGGAWYLVYPIVGNIVWFLPFGYLLRRLRPAYGVARVLLYSILLSVGIEVVQWVLLSGISDIDDVIFNALGGVFGWLLGKYPLRQTKSC